MTHLALALLATPALAADSAGLVAIREIVSTTPAPSAPTDDALFGRSNWTLAATPADAPSR